MANESSPPNKDAPDASALLDAVAEEVAHIEEVEEILAAEDEAEILDPEDAAQAAPPGRRAGSKLPETEVSAEDMEFLRRVFSKVKDVDFRGPPPPPPKGLAGPDKKLNDLRENVRKLERDLARIGWVWIRKQQEVESVTQIVAAKEEERAKAVARYQKVKALSIQTLTQLKEELAALKALASTLSGNKRELEQTVSGLEERLARSEQEKAAMVVDYRGKIEAAQNAFNALRDQSARNIGGLETQVKVRDEQVEALRSEIKALQGTLAARDATQVEAEKRILELLTRLDALDGQVAGHVTELATRDARLGELTATLGERDKALAQLAEEMSRLRAENEARLGDVRRLAKLQEDEAARLQVEVGKLQGELKQAAEACDKHRTEIERLKQQLTKM